MVSFFKIEQYYTKKIFYLYAIIKIYSVNKFRPRFLLNFVNEFLNYI